MNRYLAPTLALTILCPAVSAAAKDVSPAIKMSAACAPVGHSAPSRAPLVLALGTDTRMLYNAGDRVAISSGTSHGLSVGQRFFIRRPLATHGEMHGEHTAGWLRITEARESRATATIEFSCDAVAIGDHLEAFADSVLPRDVDRTNATGTLDFSKVATVLYGSDGRLLTGDRDFVLGSAGEQQGVTPGARYAIYRTERVRQEEAQLAFAEAVVVAVFKDKSLLRITETRDAVRSGDMLVMRTGVVAFSDDDDFRPQPLNDLDEGEGSVHAAVRAVADAVELVHSLSFEDLAFDFDRDTLKPDSLALLDQAAKVLEQNPTLSIKVEGYACDIGSEKYNLALGKRRANAVRDYLVRHGVDASRLTVVSYGEAQPKYDNHKEDTRRLNRRTALVVSIER